MRELGLRQAGRIQRYHTRSTIQTQTIAEHTWNVLRIWVELYGPPDPNVTVAIMFHDVGEARTGDLPHTVKRDHPELKEPLKEIERMHLRNLVEQHCRLGADTLMHVNNWDMMCIKMCELIEMAEFARDEYDLGNHREGMRIRRNIERAWEQLMTETNPKHEHVELADEKLEHVFTAWARYDPDEV